ncbi:glycine betaine/L-proline ABC transporter, ATPase subunit [Methanosalsum zhilinae DSM 4017]|uniref:Glycine betaine/L-proline ABC transporter, ATPase subunit n=1 Tax=Methanosalsum zhilinae (strain DSM 4017 / NBRC 107636 / OCM 62 / WeN5) TaxID=679901 RepID=F7XQ85_METZD|nr:glycine betaine/L-proline ABC transporter ATP-binding protein [Methanosalsum zhilinae]AEH61547.1 glycine betaine/L-proline ABC transporter, ATPase subunit [Methanosalsum zhilinae DSM 4017]
MEENTKIEIKDVSKIFGKNPKKVLKLLDEGLSKAEILERTGHNVGLYKLNFEIKSGEIFVIMGLSGSGKSTLLRCINRLIEPTTGEILIDDDDVIKMKPENLRELRRNKLGMVFQNFGLLPHRSVIDNVAYGLEVRGIEKEQRYEKALEAIENVGLKGHENSDISELSGGMQQRVGLARALATDPDILLMDEAFSALDPLIRSEMQDELLALQDRMQKTIVFVSHDLDEALKLGDRILLMNEGKAVQIGTAEEILTNPADDYVAKFVAGVDRSKVLLAEAVMKRPDPVISINSSLKVAVQLMKKHGISSIYVVDRNKILKGFVTIDKAIDGIKESKKIEDVMGEDVHKTAPDTPLNELIPIIESHSPLAVVDEKDKLIGVVVRGSVLGALAMED